MVAPAGLARVDAWLKSAIPVRALGGGADDAQHMSDAYFEGARTGRAVVLENGNGAFNWGSAHQLPGSDFAGPLTVIARPGCVISSSVSDPGEHASPFNYKRQDDYTVETTIAVQPAIGDRVIQVVDASSALLAPGKYTRLDRTGLDERVMTYRIVARNLGANTITVERPILLTFPVGTMVKNAIPIFNFKLFGNGLLLTGTGFKAFDLFDAWHGYVCDINCSGAYASIALDWNEGSFNSGFDRFAVDCNGGQAGAGIEEAEACWLRDGVVRNASLAGILLESPVTPVVDRCSSYANALHGLAVVGPTAAEQEGSRFLKILGSSFNGNLSCGIFLSDDAEDTIIDGTQASYNGAYGLCISNYNTLAASLRTTVGTLSAQGNVTAAIGVLAAGATGNTVSNLDCPTGTRIVVGGAGSDFVDGTPTLDPTFDVVHLAKVLFPSTLGLGNVLAGQVDVAAQTILAGAELVVTVPVTGVPNDAIQALHPCKVQPLDPATGDAINPGAGIKWGCEHVSAADTVEFRIWTTDPVSSALAHTVWTMIVLKVTT